jgi:hypothetical protein
MRIRPHFKNGHYSAVACSTASGATPTACYYWLNAYLENEAVRLVAVLKLAVRITWPMSEMGQKQTSRHLQPMSALPRKWTFVSAIVMSPLCQKRTSVRLGVYDVIRLHGPSNPLQRKLANRLDRYGLIDRQHNARGD